MKQELKLYPIEPRKRTYYCAAVFMAIMLFLAGRSIVRQNHVDFQFSAYAPTVDKAWALTLPTPTPTSTQHDLIVKEIRDVFGPDADNFLKILTQGKPGTLCPRGENHDLNPTATNVNAGGSIDYGIAQINDHWQGVTNKDFLFDYTINIRMAHDIFKKWGNFQAWTCGKVWGL